MGETLFNKTIKPLLPEPYKVGVAGLFSKGLTWTVRQINISVAVGSPGPIHWSIENAKLPRTVKTKRKPQLPDQ
jgi:hypothetical protein